MKILVISFLFPNRVTPNHGIFVLNRLKALSQYVDIKVINPIPWSPIHSRLKRFDSNINIPEKDTIEGLDVYHPRFFSIPGYFKGIESISYYRAIAPVVETLYNDFKFDLIDLHWTYPDLPAGIKLARKYSKKSLVTLRGKEAFYLQGSMLRKNIIQRELKEVDATIALSQELAGLNECLTGVSDIQVIRNGVDVDHFYYIPKEVARKKLNIKQNERFIVSVGSLIRRKGFDLLIKSLATIVNKQTFADIKLYIIGSEGPEGDFRDELYSLVDQLGLNEHIVFQGQVPNNELCLWYNSTDAFCLASRGEGSPNVLTEALACGCPVVASDVGAVKEIMESDNNLGVCILAGSVDKLASGLLKVLSQQFNREANAAKFKKYSWDWCARRVLEIYERLR
jgi:glycosyltransferase involved in cell wall biosynthesis